MEDEAKKKWLDVIDGALHDLAHCDTWKYTSQVIQAHEIVKAIQAGKLPVNALLFPAFRTEHT